MDGNLLLFLAVLPSIVLGKYIYKMDKLEKEPSNLLTKLFIFGIAAAITTLFISNIISFLLPILDSDNATTYVELFISTFIGIALVEEFCKWIYMISATWRNNNFKHVYDAIVYAVFVSLGFATLENILYVFNGGIIIALIRAIASVPGHVFDAVFMGYYYGLSKQAQVDGNVSLSNKYLFLSLVVPTILHGLFDYLLVLGNLLTLIIFVVYVIVLYIISFRKIKKISDILENMKAYYCTRCGTKCKTNYCPNCGNKMIN